MNESVDNRFLSTSSREEKQATQSHHHIHPGLLRSSSIGDGSPSLMMDNRKLSLRKTSRYPVEGEEQDSSGSGSGSGSALGVQRETTTDLALSPSVDESSYSLPAGYPIPGDVSGSGRDSPGLSAASSSGVGGSSNGGDGGGTDSAAWLYSTITVLKRSNSFSSEASSMAGSTMTEEDWMMEQDEMAARFGNLDNSRILDYDDEERDEDDLEWMLRPDPAAPPPPSTSASAQIITGPSDSNASLLSSPLQPRANEDEDDAFISPYGTVLVPHDDSSDEGAADILANIANSAIDSPPKDRLPSRPQPQQGENRDEQEDLGRHPNSLRHNFAKISLRDSLNSSSLIHDDSSHADKEYFDDEDDEDDDDDDEDSSLGGDDNSMDDEARGDLSLREGDIAAAVTWYRDAIADVLDDDDIHNNTPNEQPDTQYAEDWHTIPQRARVARIMTKLSDLYADATSIEASCRLGEEALSLLSDLYGESHPQVLAASALCVDRRSRVAASCFHNGDWTMAIFHCREILWLCHFSDKKKSNPEQPAYRGRLPADSFTAENILPLIPLFEENETENNDGENIPSLSLTKSSSSRNTINKHEKLQKIKTKASTSVKRGITKRLNISRRHRAESNTKDDTTDEGFRLGCSLQTKGHHDEAIHHLRLSLRRSKVADEDSSTDVTDKLALSCTATGDWNAALLYYRSYFDNLADVRRRRQLKKDASVSELWIVGIISSATCSPHDAIDWYRKACTKSAFPPNHAVWQTLDQLCDITRPRKSSPVEEDCDTHATDCRDARDILARWGLDQLHAFRQQTNNKEPPLPDFTVLKRFLHQQKENEIHEGGSVGGGGGGSLMEDASALFAYGNLLFRRSHYAECITYYEEGLSALGEEGTCRDGAVSSATHGVQERVEVHTNLGTANLQLGHQDKSDYHFDEGLEKLAQSYAQQKIATQQQQQEHASETPNSEFWSKIVNEVRNFQSKSNDDESHHRTFTSYRLLILLHIVGIGMCLDRRYSESIKVLERVLRVRAQVLGWEHAEVAALHADLIMVRTFGGHMHEARRMFVSARTQLCQLSRNGSHPTAAQLKRFCEWRRMKADFLFSLV